MLDRYLIEFGAPTLASIKVGSMFWFDFDDHSELWAQLALFNCQLSSRGVTITTLRLREKRALLYVYRERQLEKVLESPEIRDFMTAYGYACDTIPASITHLRRRIAETDSFPHEVGIFLGYPLEDVRGFIENRGQKSLYSGIWKVYHDAEGAKHLFERYKRCRDIYRRLWIGGKSVKQLTVAV